MRWQLREAKQKFGSAMRRALEEGPRVVTRHGKDSVVVVSAKESRRLKGEPDFKAFLLAGPDFDDLDLARAPGRPRRIA